MSCSGALSLGTSSTICGAVSVPGGWVSATCPCCDLGMARWTTWRPLRISPALHLPSAQSRHLQEAKMKEWICLLSQWEHTILSVPTWLTVLKSHKRKSPKISFKLPSQQTRWRSKQGAVRFHTPFKPEIFTGIHTILSTRCAVSFNPWGTLRGWFYHKYHFATQTKSFRVSVGARSWIEEC